MFCDGTLERADQESPTRIRVDLNELRPVFRDVKIIPHEQTARARLNAGNPVA